jgi:aconitate hydratase
MGVLPLQFLPGQNAATLGLDGSEHYSTLALDDTLQPRQEVAVRAVRADGSMLTFATICRIDTPVEVDYYRNGGILHTVLRQFLRE